MHRDLQIRDLKDDNRHPAFVIVGQPEIRIHAEPNGEVSVELLGYDTYDPATGTVKAGGANDVACWMLDTAYDGTSFFARRIHFPGAHDDRQIKKLRAQLGRSLDKLRWDAALSISPPHSPNPPKTESPSKSSPPPEPKCPWWPKSPDIRSVP